jgi:hypothetical protein
MNEFLRKYSVNRNFLTFACACSPSPLDCFDHLCFHSIDKISPVSKKKHRQEQTILLLLTCTAVAAVAKFVLKIEERVDELPPSFVAVAVCRGSSIGKICAIYFKFATGGDQYLGDH